MFSFRQSFVQYSEVYAISVRFPLRHTYTHIHMNEHVLSRVCARSDTLSQTHTRHTLCHVVSLNCFFFRFTATIFDPAGNILMTGNTVGGKGVAVYLCLCDGVGRGSLPERVKV